MLNIQRIERVDQAIQIVLGFAGRLRLTFGQTDRRPDSVPTRSDEFAVARPEFRGRQLMALARVTASEFGNPAPGYEEAKRLLPG